MGGGVGGRALLCIASCVLAAVPARAEPRLPSLRLAAPQGPWVVARRQSLPLIDLRPDAEQPSPGIAPHTAWLLALPNLDRAPLELGMNLDMGTRDLGVRLDGTLRVAADYPVVSARLRLNVAGRELDLPLPSVQVVPRRELGLFYVEVKMNLLDHRF